MDDDDDDGEEEKKNLREEEKEGRDQAKSEAGWDALIRAREILSSCHCLRSDTRPPAVLHVPLPVKSRSWSGQARAGWMDGRTGPGLYHPVPACDRGYSTIRGWRLFLSG